MSKFNQLIQGDTPVLVDFYADWCGPCKIIAPILKEVKAELGDQLKIIKVDVDRNPQAAAQFSVRGIPTMILFRKGQQLWRQSGAMPKDQLLQAIQQKIT